MIDLHTHSLFSDGVLIPSELVQRARTRGYEAIAITDHVDDSNLDQIVPSIRRVCEVLASSWEIAVIPGVEITHVPPEIIPRLANAARSLGARIVLVHGETLVEPVPSGTNRAALDSAIDILAHPGLISVEEVCRAKERHICLEITSRQGHSLTNGHVARLALQEGALLILNTDTHGPNDLIDDATGVKILRGAGVPEDKVSCILENAHFILNRLNSPFGRKEQ